MMVYARFDGPLGAMLATASPKGLLGVSFVGQKYAIDVPRDWREAPDETVLTATIAQIREYFGGRRTRFDVPLDLHGTPFQMTVWHLLIAIPFGATATYGQVAARLGAPPGAARAVGAAIGHNPVSVIVPCHRVIGSNGTLTGYAGGLDRKRALLELERAWPLEPSHP